MYRPFPLFRGPHVQSIVSALAVRRWALELRGARIHRDAVEHRVPTDEGTLQAFVTPPAGAGNGRLAVLLHGWEGCHGSNYVLAVGEALRLAGFSVARLNLRDHGDSHAWNEEMFHANRIEEVTQAVAWLVDHLRPDDTAAVGFSLGGNFALRVGMGLGLGRSPVDRVVAVNPPLDPADACEAIDRQAIYRTYFVRRWKRSLRKKQAAFPHLYRFDDVLALGTVLELTDRVIPRHSSFPSAQAYFAGYALPPERLGTLRVPATIVTTKDDPIIGIETFESARSIPGLELEVQDFGGHCGYLLGPSMVSWLEHRIPELIA